MSGKRTSEKHPTLYHYTGIEAFRNIMETQTLWARNYRYLNDVSEVVHLKSRLRKALVPRLIKEIETVYRDNSQILDENENVDDIAREEANGALNLLFQQTFGEGADRGHFPPYVVSFCSHIDDKNGFTKENGLLSMWRAYGRNGGLALVFDTERLEDLIGQETDKRSYNIGSLGDVVYEGDDEAFNSEFKHFTETFVEAAVSLLRADRSTDPFDSDFVTSFFNAATRFKHIAFAEEREVRLALAPWTEGQHSLESLAAGQALPKIVNGTHSEHIELFGESIGRLPVLRVIVGPFVEQDSRIEEVRSIVRNDIEVIASSTPYTEGPRVKSC